MISVIEVNSFREGLMTGLPFVIKGMWLPCSFTDCKARANGLTIFGYNDNGDCVESPAIEVINAFENNTANINVVDAPFPVLFAIDLPVGLREAVIESDEDICITMTQRGKYTPFHIDPDRGGGWMYLQYGEKKWQLIEAKYANQFRSECGNSWVNQFIDAPKDFDSEILLSTTIFGGDFIYFPPNTLHRVWTNENSFGASGYAKPIINNYKK